MAKIKKIKIKKLWRRLSKPSTSILFKLLGSFLTMGLVLVILAGLIIATLENVGNHISEIATASHELRLAMSLKEDNNRILSLVTRLRKDTNRALTPLEMSSLLVLEVDANSVGNDPTGRVLNIGNSATSANTGGSGGSQGNNLQQQEDAAQSVYNLMQSVVENTNNLIATSITSTERNEFITILQNSFRKIVRGADDVVSSVQNNQINAALLALGQLRANWSEFDRVTQSIDSFNSKLDQDIKQVADTSGNATNVASTTRSSAEVILVIAVLLALGMAVGLGVLLTFNFSNPLRKLQKRLLNLAEGDLATPLSINNRDQFGQMAHTFNRSIGRMGATVELLQKQSLKVNSASTQLATTSRQLATTTSEQAASIAQTTTNIEELSQTVQMIATAAQKVSMAATQALANAERGQEVLHQTTVGITVLKNRVEEIARNILALTARSQQAGSVVNQINAIAEETHLLALNAAIESAAAGVEGHRFGVVATHVKQLSARSRVATQEVQAVLNEIQMATTKCVMATEQGMKEAELGVAIVHKGGEANLSIIEAAEQTAQLADAIVLATQQQLTGSGQAVKTMRHLTTSVQETANSSQQNLALAVALEEVANQLKQVGGQFKIKLTAPHLAATTQIVSTPTLVEEVASNGTGKNFTLRPLPIKDGSLKFKPVLSVVAKNKIVSQYRTTNSTLMPEVEATGLVTRP